MQFYPILTAYATVENCANLSLARWSQFVTTSFFSSSVNSNMKSEGKRSKFHFTACLNPNAWSIYYSLEHRQGVCVGVYVVVCLGHLCYLDTLSRFMSRLLECSEPAAKIGISNPIYCRPFLSMRLFRFQNSAPEESTSVFPW